jgi:hypothetical protein
VQNLLNMIIYMAILQVTAIFSNSVIHFYRIQRAQDRRQILSSDLRKSSQKHPIPKLFVKIYILHEILVKSMQVDSLGIFVCFEQRNVQM